MTIPEVPKVLRSMTIKQAVAILRENGSEFASAELLADDRADGAPITARRVDLIAYIAWLAKGERKHG